MIMNIQVQRKEEAEMMITAVAQWLLTYTEPEDRSNYPSTGEDKSAALARSWARLLLESSRANGLHGCRLCQN